MTDCPTGKLIYPTAQAAAGALRGIAARTRARAAGVSYRCACCGGWHISRNKAKPAARTRRREDLLAGEERGHGR